MINPWLIVGLLVAWGVSIAGVGLTAFDMGQDRAKASQAEKQALVAEAVDAALATTATAIAGIEIKHQTIRQEIQREIRMNTVYADCRHSPGGLRGVNDALAELENGIRTPFEMCRELGRIGVQANAEQGIVILPGSAQRLNKSHGRSSGIGKGVIVTY